MTDPLEDLAGGPSLFYLTGADTDLEVVDALLHGLVLAHPLALAGRAPLRLRPTQHLAGALVLVLRRRHTVRSVVRHLADVAAIHVARVGVHK